MVIMSRRRITAVSAVLFPIAAAAVLVWIETQQVRWLEVSPAPVWVDPEELEVLHVSSANELLDSFRRVGYDSLPYYGAIAVPRYALLALPHDLNTLDVESRKSVFFRSLLPIIVAENQRIRAQRRQLIELFALPFTSWSESNINWVVGLKDGYRVDGSIRERRTREELIRRIDELPPALVLAQAANESAWGTSRFAKLGNNLFGLWTYDESQGIVPINRGAGEKHAVQVFPDITTAIRAYFLTLNTHSAYAELRHSRSTLRAANLPLDARILAGGLRKYSSRGEAYVTAIRSLIERHRLAGLRNSTLRPPMGRVVASRS